MSTLLFGGTFDPIHLGHLSVAARVQQQFHFDEFLFVPCYLPVHKAAPQTATNHRLAMLSEALIEYPIEHATVSDIEITKTTPSYTLDTLKCIRKTLDQNTPLIFLLGLDSFLSFPNDWQNFHELLTLTHLLIVERPVPSNTLPAVLKALLKTHETTQPNTLQQTPHGHIYRFDAGATPISSTTVRQRLLAHQPVDDLLCASTCQYIKAHQLYS